MNTISILLVERNRIDMDHSLACLARNPAFHVIGCCTDIRQACAFLQLHRTDIVICEMVLGGNDGMALLRRLHSSADRPMILMTSCLASDCALQSAGYYGADYFMLKPFTADSLEQTILMMLRRRSALHMPEPDPAALRNIHRLLVESGFTSRYRGYHYLATGLQLISANPQLMSSLTKALYVQIAEQYQTLASRVERDIRHAIRGACLRSGLPVVSNGTALRILVRALHTRHDRID